MSDPERPALRIVRGEPSAEEIAAITAVVSAAAAGPAPEGGAPAKPAPGRWNDPAYSHRGHWTVGAGGWRSAR